MTFGQIAKRAFVAFAGPSTYSPRPTMLGDRIATDGKPDLVRTAADPAKKKL